MPEFVEPAIEVHHEGGIATVTLCRPDVHDALDPEAFTRLGETFEERSPPTRKIGLMPGDDLVVSMWVDGNECLFQTRNDDGDVVIDQGVMHFA